MTTALHSTVTQEKADESTERKRWLDAVTKKVLYSYVAESVEKSGWLAGGKTCWRPMAL